MLGGKPPRAERSKGGKKKKKMRHKAKNAERSDLRVYVFGVYIFGSILLPKK